MSAPGFPPPPGEEKISLPLPEPVNEALARLEAAGWEAVAVGGCVRDLLRGVPPGDFDLATSAPPEATERVFAGEKLVETGLKHGTVTVLIGGMPLEITPFRVDGGYSDGRRPDGVRFTASLREDLARRDFTVNAMALNWRGNLCDPFGGREDLKAGILRCVGEPAARLREDGLRILRALRFAAALDFEIEPATAAALSRERERLRLVSPERVQAELRKLLCGPAVRRVLLDYTEVLGVALPELLPMRGFDQRNIHHIYDVLEHSAAAVEAVPPTPTLRLAALLHDAGKPDCFTLDEQGCGHFYGHPERSAELADAALRRLRFDTAIRERVVLLVRCHDRPIAGTEAALRRALNRLGPEVFFELLQLKRADNLAQSPAYRGRQAEYDALERAARALLDRGDCLSLKTLAVHGGDLIAAGFTPGRELGDTLRRLLNAVLDGEALNEKEALLALAEKGRKICVP